MDDQIGTVKELLKQSFQSAPYATNGNTNVHSIPGFGDCLLKIPVEEAKFKKSLIATTCLTPVHLCAENFGQPLLTAKSFDIVRKVEGQSLQDIFDRYYDKHLLDIHSSMREARVSAYKDMLEMLHDLPDSSFTEYFNAINYLSSHGIQADLHWGNILLDGKKLNLIDTLPENGPTVNYLDAVRRGLTDFGGSSGIIDDPDNMKSNVPELITHIQKLETKIERIARVCGIPDWDKIAERIPWRTLPYKGLSRIEGMQRIALKDTPHALRVLLDKVKTYQPPRINL